ncbi:MAG: helix-turn-helix domain protein [Clostridiaceae bacterium]|nr:helix-turn-helix domain protein [Clostridiaceae bacterium]
MQFLTTGEKIKNLRKILGIRQEQLTSIGISRNFISMVENNKRNLSLKTAKLIVDEIKLKSVELGIDLNIDEEYILKTPSEDARDYCSKKLVEELSADDIEKLNNLCNRYNLIDILPQLYSKKGDLFYNSNKFDEAFTYFYDALEIYTHINNLEDKALIYNKLGKCRLKVLEYIESLSFFKKAYSLSSEEGFMPIEKNSLYNMALVYKKLNKIDESLEQIHKYIEICNDDLDFPDIIDARILEANCYSIKNQFEKSISIYKEILDNNKLKSSILASIYNNLGRAYIEMKDLRNSLIYFNKSQKIREVNDKSKLHLTLINKSNVFLQNKMINEAINLLKKAFNLSIIYNDIECIMVSFNMLEKIYLDMSDKNSLASLYQEMLQAINLNNNNIKSFLLVYVKISNKLMLIDIDNNNIEDCKNRIKELNNLIDI